MDASTPGIDRYGDRWLGSSSDRFWEWFDRRIEQGRSLPTSQVALIAEEDAIQFAANFLAAVELGWGIVLTNPRWGKGEWQQLEAIVCPDVIWGEPEWVSRRSLSECDRVEPGQILIPTGGSSGKLRFAVHTWETLMASVQDFQRFWECDRVNSYCVLPLYHVSGLMQLMRSFTSGGNLAIESFKQLEAGAFSASDRVDSSEWFISLVPTQLQRLIDRSDCRTWLSTFRAILLGGGPTWPTLLNQARRYQLPIAPTYGMTETAAQVATLKPEEFLAGKTGVGRSLPHAQIYVQMPVAGDRPSQGQGTGPLVIHSPSLFLKYIPPEQEQLVSSLHEPQKTFVPDDIGFWDREGYLHIVGRNSDKIITGGENVFPAEVEAAILATGLVDDVAVTGVPDDQWGETVVAVYVPLSSAIKTSELARSLESTLSRFKLPKQWVAVASLPRNAQGKLNRIELQIIAKHCKAQLG